MARLRKLDDWQLRGKIAIRAKTHSDSAVINSWQQQGDRYEVVLSSAVLGLGRTELRGNTHQIEISKGNGERFYSDSPSELIFEQTGWLFPIKQIASWIKGIPAQVDQYDIAFTDGGEPHQIQQSEWTILPSRFTQVGQYTLPRKLIAMRDDHRVTVVVTEWVLDKDALLIKR